jgi:hypothetical protein
MERGSARDPPLQALAVQWFRVGKHHFLSSGKAVKLGLGADAQRLRDGLGLVVGTKKFRNAAGEGGYTHLIVYLAVHLTVAAGAALLGREQGL